VKRLKDFMPGMVVKPSHEHNYTKNIAFKVHAGGDVKYILARQCDGKECNKSKAWDLVDEIPSRRVQQ
jgi:hypothetical protein